jgi:hypothetical protein
MNVMEKQGGQIGRLFDFWAIVFFLLWAFLKYRHGTIFLANFRLLGEWLFTLGIFKYRYGTIFIANFRQLGDWLFTLKIF